MSPPLYERGSMQPVIYIAPTTTNSSVQQRKPLHDSHSIQGTHIRQPNGAIPRRIRPLTVNEALQYSPLSSIAPFDSGAIPFPTAGLPTSQPVALSSLERSSTRQRLELLDEDLASRHGKVAQHALHVLKPLLNADEITEFKFKVPSGFLGRLPSRDSSTKNNLQSPSAPRLGLFSNAAMKAVDVAYTYPTPSPSPLSNSKNQDSPRSHVGRLPASPTTPQRYSHNKSAHLQNNQTTVNGWNASTPQRTNLQPVVIVPPLPPSSQPSEYKTYPDLPAANDSSAKNSRKRKHGESEGTSDFSGRTKDQRALSSEALNSLKDLLSDILDAEAQEKNGALSNKATKEYTFFTKYGEDETQMILTASTHVKLESCLQKVITFGRFAEVPVDYLLQVQKLCEPALASTGSVDVTITPGWDGEEVSKWLGKIETADLGLRTTRTILRIMCGRREEKELCSEELLQKVLEVIRKIVESCVIPVVEVRTTGANSELFDFASSHKRTISQLVHSIMKSLLLVNDLLVEVDLAESTITTLEFFLTRILFVENAHSEKESVLSIHRFEALRRTAMDTIAEIFLRYPEQRTFLFDEILGSLQKLPVTRQHARQFKLADGRSIQLVSALIMRLVQTSGMRSTSTPSRKRKLPRPEYGEQESSNSGQSGEESDDSNDGRSSEDSAESGSEALDRAGKDGKAAGAKSELQRLADDAQSLYNSSTGSAQYVTRFFVYRASTASKSGDQPHRHLLDIFAEDLIEVLGLPEWPGAQLLLRSLLYEMTRIIQTAKSTAPAKNMALELLGLMGSAISDLSASTRNLAKSLENDDSQYTSNLLQLMEDHATSHLYKKELVDWTGPYRAVLEYLNALGSEKLQNLSAQGYLLTQWAKLLCSENPTAPESSEDMTINKKPKDFVVKLHEMLLIGKWPVTDDFDLISSVQGRLAYALVVLNLEFCQALNHILKFLLDSISSDQSTVRTRSLKSVTQMLEKDPALMDRVPLVLNLITKCASDSSPLVRDSALQLIGKCLLLKPALEDEMYKIVLIRTDDSAIGVRKRSMKLLKDIYLRNQHKTVKTAIANSIFQRAQDPEESVSELARQIFEDIWLSPFWAPQNSRSPSAEAMLRLKEQVSLVIKTVQRGESVSLVLNTLLRQVLSSKSKNAVENFNACKLMVATAFEGIIDTEELPGKPEQQHILQALTIFANADPKLFDAQQLQHLQPYVGTLSGADDLNLFRSVVVILRSVLPTLPTMQQDFLKNVQLDLLKSVSKLGKTELDEVVSCLWSINGKLDNIEKLIAITTSVLAHMHKLEGIDFSEPGTEDRLTRVKRYIRIAGYFGKYCDFQPQVQSFKKQLPWFAGDSVPEFIIRSMRPYATTKQPLSLKISALEGIGFICQAWPGQFNERETTLEFQSILREGHPELQRIILSSFRDFFAAQDLQVGMKGQAAATAAKPEEGGKLGASAKANDNDGAAALIAQGFLKEILRIALASQDEYAVTATQVIASIVRQGLVHPRECSPALVALETSTNPRIAEIAFKEHQNVHQQHESMFEREYMRAVHEAFVYQRDVVKNCLGATGQPYVSKLRLMFDVIKMSSSKYQKKFLSNLCMKVDFDPAKLDVSSKPPSHLMYSRFLTENLAFFEYGRLDELQHIIAGLERIVASTGAGIAHHINTEVFRVVLGPPTKDAAKPDNGIITSDSTSKADIDLSRLRHLTTASTILSVVWETRTFLRRLYGLDSNQARPDGKGKTSKDLTKAPSKVQGISGDRLMESIDKVCLALDSRELMVDQCKRFAELLSVDDEVKIQSDQELDGGRNETPSVDEDGDAPMPASGGTRPGKRKSSVSVAEAPLKKKRGRPSLGNRKKSGRSVDDGENSY